MYTIFLKVPSTSIVVPNSNMQYAFIEIINTLRLLRVRLTIRKISES